MIALPDAATSITLCRLRYKVLFREPPYEDDEIEFLWPMRIQVRKGLLILSFVVFERSVSNFFPRQCSILSRTIEEQAVVAGFRSLGATTYDLHKGIKTLWKEDFMDAFKVKYKEPFALASKEMDEEIGIKAMKPEFFEELQDYTLYSTMFKVSPSADCSVKLFHADPFSGSISFPRYTEGEGDSDEVVFKILDANS